MPGPGRGMPGDRSGGGPDRRGGTGQTGAVDAGFTATLLRVLPLAFGAAISPVILLLQVATLASPRYPVRRACIVLAATALVVVAVMGVVLATDAHAGAAPTSDPVVDGWIRIVLALVLLAGALRTALRPAPDGDAPPPDDADPGVRGVRFFLLGLGAMAANVTTIVLLVPATREVATADIGDDRLVVLAVVFVVTLLPAYGPLLVLAALGRRGPAALAAMSTWLRAHRRAVTVVVSLGFAAYLGISGLVALG